MLKGRFKTAAVLLLFVSILSLWSGCGGSGEMKNGTFTAREKGYGGDVIVSVTVKSGKLDDVVILAEKETPAIGQAAVPVLRERIMKAQGAGVEAVSGASFTSRAVLSAAEQAFAEAAGTAKTAARQVEMADGVYTAETWSFSPNFPMKVEVAVKGNRFESVRVIAGNDTKPILDSALSLLVPRMIENQSLSVDSITGATASSNAIKKAAEDCLVQAITAAGGSGKSVEVFYKVQEKTEREENIETDILVVGMGGSGIAAAVRAAETIFDSEGKTGEGVRVLGIDKAGKYGGTSAVTSSPMAINPPSFVAENNGRDYVDAEELKSAWIEYTEGDAKEWAIDCMMDYSGIVADWLIDKGFSFGAPMQGLAHPYKAVVAYGGGFGVSKAEVAGYFDSIMDYYTSLGGKYLLETSATGFLTNENGEVTGITAEGADGTKYTIKAKAVILATGGFAGSRAMTDKYLSTRYYPLTGEAYNLYGMHQNDGTMIEAALQNGAAAFNIGVPPVSHIGGAAAIMHVYDTEVLDGTFDIWTGREMTRSLNDIPMMMAVAPDSMAVNRDGVRFTDETALGSYGNWQAGPRYYTIWSAEMIDEIRREGLRFDTNGLFINQGGWPSGKPVENIEEILENAAKYGIAVKASTLEELAGKLKIKSGVLRKTVDDYNRYCEDRKAPADGINKSPVVYDLSGKPIENRYSTFRKVEGDGPYYAVTGSPWIYSTAGGLDIDSSFRVLDTEGHPVKGLYAVGTDSLGVLLTEKKEYVGYGGVAQGWAFTSGYLAGESAVELLKN